MNLADREERDGLAGEYVLGVLSPAEHAQIEGELPRNAELRRAVAYWRDRLLPMTDVASPVAPSPALWAWIERDLFGAPAVASERTATQRAERPRWWESLAFWRTSALIAAAAALVLALAPMLRGTLAPTVTYIAVLEAPDRTPGWIVQATADQPLRLTPLARDTVGDKQSLQFWTLFDKAQGPVSLGLVRPNETKTVPRDRLPGLKEGQLFEITLEPYGGSPVGRPTGKILYKGLIVESR
jgi:anti-sigma-K factor RskA